MLALRRVYKQIAIVAMRPCCKTGTKGMLRRRQALHAQVRHLFRHIIIQPLGSNTYNYIIIVNNEFNDYNYVW